MRHIVIFIGKPGSGKDTISKKVSQDMNIPLIIAGDLLRREVENDTEIGKKIADILRRGDLVDDDIILTLLEKELKKREEKIVIINGFPRSYKQALLFVDMIKNIGFDIALVFELDVPDEVVIERIVLRRICPKCGRVYNLKFNPPKYDETCDYDGEKLIQREDDKEDVVKHRLEKFYEEIEDIRKLFEKDHKLYKIDANRNIEDIVKEVEKIIKEVK